MPNEVRLPNEDEVNMLSQALNGAEVGNIEDFGIVGNIEDFGSYQASKSQQPSQPHQLSIMPNATQQQQSGVVNMEETPITPEKGTMRSVLEFLGKEGSALAGAYGGFKAGAALPVPPQAKPFTAIAGAAAGAGSSYLAADRISQFDNPDFDWNQAFKDAGEVAAWEAGGGLVVRGIGTIAAPFIKEANVAHLDAKQAAQQLLQKHDATFLKSMVSGGSLDKVVDSLAVSGIGGKAGVVQENAMKIENALNSEINKMLEFRKASGNGEAPADAVLGLVNKAKSTLSDSFDTMKTRLATEGGRVDTAPIKAYAENVLKIAESGTRPLSEPVKQAAKELRDMMSKNLSADDLDYWRRNLNSYIEKAKDGKETADQIKYLQDMKTVFDSTLDNAIEKNASPELKNLYRSEQAKYADAMKSLKSDTLVKLAKDPTLMGRMFAGNSQELKVGEIYSAVSKAAELTGVPARDAIKNMQAGYLEQLFKLPQAGDLSIQHIAKIENKLRDPRTRATMEAVLGKFGANRLDTILYASRLAKEGEPKGMLELMITSRQGQAVTAGLGALAGAGAIATGGALGTAGVVTAALIPKILSYVAVNPQRTNEFLKIDRLLRDAPVSGFKRATALAAMARFVEENQEAFFGGKVAQDEQSAQQANPMFNPMQSTLQ